MNADLDDTVYYDQVIPHAWIRRLRDRIIRFGAMQIFWTSLDYAPSNFFEQVVLHLQPVARPPAGCIGAEYWARAQPAGTGFHFHYDRDEAKRDRIVSPRLSSILYLSDAGGPTLIVDATPRGARLPTRGRGVIPARGRLATFPGQFLHGVQPGAASRWPRVAMFINWWDHRPLAAKQPDTAFCATHPIAMYRPGARHVRGKRPPGFPAHAALNREDWARIVEKARWITS